MPALCRASTSFFCSDSKQDVDGRDKPGHDDVASHSPNQRSAYTVTDPHKPFLMSQPQIKLLDQIVVVELLGRAALERDLAVYNDIAAVGDAQRLREVLLRHQHGELVALLELLDLLDRARDQHRRK